MQDITAMLPFFDTANDCVQKLTQYYKKQQLTTHGVVYDEMEPILRWMYLDCKAILDSLPKSMIALRLMLMCHESVRCHPYVKLTFRCVARQIIKSLDNVPNQSQLNEISRITRQKQEDILCAIPLLTYYQAEFNYKNNCVLFVGLDDNVDNLLTFFERHLFRDEMDLLDAHLHVINESDCGGWLANLAGLIYPSNADLTSSLFGLEFGHMFGVELPARTLPMKLLQDKVYFRKQCSDELKMMRTLSGVRKIINSLLDRSFQLFEAGRIHSVGPADIVFLHARLAALSEHATRQAQTLTGAIISNELSKTRMMKKRLNNKKIKCVNYLPVDITTIILGYCMDLSKLCHRDENLTKIEFISNTSSIHCALIKSMLNLNRGKTSFHFTLSARVILKYFSRILVVVNLSRFVPPTTNRFKSQFLSAIYFCELSALVFKRHKPCVYLDLQDLLMNKSLASKPNRREFSLFLQPFTCMSLFMDDDSANRQQLNYLLEILTLSVRVETLIINDKMATRILNQTNPNHVAGIFMCCSILDYICTSLTSVSLLCFYPTPAIIVDDMDDGWDIGHDLHVICNVDIKFLSARFLCLGDIEIHLNTVFDETQEQHCIRFIKNRSAHLYREGRVLVASTNSAWLRRCPQWPDLSKFTDECDEELIDYLPIRCQIIHY